MLSPQVVDYAILNLRSPEIQNIHNSIPLNTGFPPSDSEELSLLSTLYLLSKSEVGASFLT